MSPRVRLVCYFCAAFFPAFGASAKSAHTASDWIVAVMLSAGAGFTSLVAFLDHSEHDNHNPPPPAVPA